MSKKDILTNLTEQYIAADKAVESQEDAEVFKEFEEWYSAHEDYEYVMKIFTEAAEAHQYKVRISSMDIREHFKDRLLPPSHTKPCDSVETGWGSPVKAFVEFYTYRYQKANSAIQKEFYFRSSNSWTGPCDEVYDYFKFIAFKAWEMGSASGAAIISHERDSFVMGWGKEKESFIEETCREEIGEAFGDIGDGLDTLPGLLFILVYSVSALFTLFASLSGFFKGFVLGFKIFTVVGVLAVGFYILKRCEKACMKEVGLIKKQ